MRVNIRADQKLPIEIIKDLTLQLQGLENSINASRDSEKLERVKFRIDGEVRTSDG